MCVLKWNKRDSFQKKKHQCYWTVCSWNKRGSFQKTTKKKHQFITVCYSTCVRIEMFWNNRGKKQHCIFNLCAYWNETGGTVLKKKHHLLYAIQVCILKSNKRGSFQKNPIDDNMLLNSCAKWIERGSFPKTHKLLLYAIQLVCVLKWNKRDSFQKKIKKHQFITVYYSTRGAVFKNTNLLHVCYSTCVHIEIKQDGQFSKKSNWWQYATELVCEMNREGQFSKNTQIITVCYSTCVKWNKRDSFKKKQKKHQFITVYYSTRKFSENNNLLLYAIQLVCILKSNKMDRFQKNPIDDNMLLNSCAKWIERGSFPKTHKLLLYAIQLVCVLKWNKRAVFKKNKKKTTKKKKHQFITVCYSTCVHIEIKQDGQFSKKSNWWQYATELVCEMNREGQFSKNTQIITVCYSTCVHIEMKQEGQFSKKNTKNTNMLLQVCYSTRGAVFKKQQFITVCYSTCVVLKCSFQKKKQKTPIYYSMLFKHIEIKQDGQISKKSNWWQYATELMCEMKQEGQFSKNTQIITVCYSTCVRIEMKQEG